MELSMLKIMLYCNILSLAVCLLSPVQATSSRTSFTSLLDTITRPLDEIPLTEIWGVAGKYVQLPCDGRAPLFDGVDSPSLIIMYKGSTPIYSIDAREGKISSAIHWSSDNSSHNGKRLYFILKEAMVEQHILKRNRTSYYIPQTHNTIIINGQDTILSHHGISSSVSNILKSSSGTKDSLSDGLLIQKLARIDGGDYHCRVDFHNSPTRNVRIRLHVIERPRKLIIKSETGLELNGVIGPYPLGGSVTLVCQVTGGQPPPQVVWIHKSIVLDEVMEIISHGEVSTNRLLIGSIRRNHLMYPLTCKATNSNLTEPLTATVKLDVTFPPESVHILDKEMSVVEGKEIVVECEVRGSKPPPDVTWWKNGKSISSIYIKNKQEGTVTISTLTIKLNREDDQAKVTCRAVNKLLPLNVLEASYNLHVLFAPKIILKAGSGVNLDMVKEGDDVYFECRVHSNPQVNEVIWYKQGDVLKQNISEGIILSNHSLVLQQVTRLRSGDYHCQATNNLGFKRSQPVHLSVKFSPVCVEDQKWIYGTSRKQKVHVSCGVESNPEPSFFKWSFNSSSEIIDLPRNDTFFVNSTNDELFHSYTKSFSGVTYMPRTHLEFGSLLCWAVNSVGMQRDPCLFQVLPAATPEPVHNCTVRQNATAPDMVLINCQPGWNGGLKQTFRLGIYRTNSIAPLAVLNNSIHPGFVARDLEPGTEYFLNIVSINNQGASNPVTFAHFIPIDIAKETLSAVAVTNDEDANNAKQDSLNSINGIIMGIIGGIFLSFTIIIFVIVGRVYHLFPRNNHQKSSNRHEKMDHIISSKRKSGQPAKELLNSSNPDVIGLDTAEEVAIDRVIRTEAHSRRNLKNASTVASVSQTYNEATMQYYGGKDITPSTSRHLSPQSPTPSLSSGCLSTLSVPSNRSISSPSTTKTTSVILSAISTQETVKEYRQQEVKTEDVISNFNPVTLMFSDGNNSPASKATVIISHPLQFNDRESIV